MSDATSEVAVDDGQVSDSPPPENGPCSAGASPVLLASVKGAKGIAVDSTNVYWTTYGYGVAAVMKCAVGGCGGGPTIVASGLALPTWIAVDSANIYWTDVSGNENAVMKCAVGGCAQPTILVKYGSGGSGGIALDSTSIYWSNLMYQPGTIAECSLTGCMSSYSDTGAPPTMVIVLEAITGLGAIAVDHSKNLYFTDDNIRGSLIEKCAPGAYLDGGALISVPCLARIVLAQQTTSPFVPRIAVDGTNVYWTTWAGTVLKCAVNGCNDQPTVLASGQSSPTAIAVDATSVYWTTLSAVYQLPDTGALATHPDGTIMKCAISGCNDQPTTLASGQDIGSESDIALDSGCVYWTTLSGVAKVAK
jgi:hypothetical protein